MTEEPRLSPTELKRFEIPKEIQPALQRAGLNSPEALLNASSDELVKRLPRSVLVALRWVLAQRSASTGAATRSRKRVWRRRRRRRLTCSRVADKKKLLAPASTINKLERFLSGGGQPALLLTLLSERERDIFVRRNGLDGRPSETLASVGDRYCITRERVRQIEAKQACAIGEAIRRAYPEAVGAVALQLEAGSIATLSDLARILFGESRPTERALTRAVLGALGDTVVALEPEGTLWGHRSPVTDRFGDIVLHARRLLVKRLAIDLDALALEIAGRLGLRESSQITTIRRCLVALPTLFRRIELRGDELRNRPSSPTAKAKSFAYTYVKTQGVPVKLREIYDALRAEQPELIPNNPSERSTLHTLNAMASRDPRIAWAGPMTYALTEWGYNREVTSAGAAALEVLRNARRPLSASEIADLVVGKYRVTRDAVENAIRTEGRFVKAGRGLYAPHARASYRFSRARVRGATITDGSIDAHPLT